MSDAADRPRGAALPYAVLLAAMPFHAFFGLALMSSHQLLASNFFTELSLPWVPDLLADQRLGGGIGWGFTEIPLLLVLIALMWQWARSDERQSRREDRKADADDDADLAAYNAMLAAMAKHDQRTGS